MYVRSIARRGSSSPPPGYAGTAFGRNAADLPGRALSEGETMEGKRHTPEEYGGRLPIPGPPSPPETAPIPAGLAELLGELRGRIGTEEAILLLVILLISADGAGVETLLLGLLLLAGRGT